MKFAILLLLVSVIGVSLGWDQTRNGRPGCKTPEEITQRFYRNHYDSTVYFECTTLGVGAEWRNCPGEHMYQPSKSTCVPNDVWEWEPNVDPPSFADL